MKLLTILFGCVGLVSAAAYQIHPELPDGIYWIPAIESPKFRRGSLYYGEPINLDELPNKDNRRQVTYGEPIRLFDEAVARSTPWDVGLVQRTVPLPIDQRVGQQFAIRLYSVLTNSVSMCYDATESRQDDTGAINNLKTKCSKGDSAPAWSHGKSGILLSRWGSSLAYVCSWGGVNPCAADEIDYADKELSNYCGGDLAAGIICMSDWKKCYGHSTYQSTICDNQV